MLENPAARADTGSLCGDHEVLFTQGENLTADDTGDSGPAKDDPELPLAGRS